MDVEITYPSDFKDGPKQTVIIPVSPEAMEAVRLAFNPSAQQKVTTLKVLGAALLESSDIQQNDRGLAGRSWAVARTYIETGIMWAVKAATVGL
jgi:hypothetical protein